MSSVNLIAELNKSKDALNKIERLIALIPDGDVEKVIITWSVSKFSSYLNLYLEKGEDYHEWLKTLSIREWKKDSFVNHCMLTARLDGIVVSLYLPSGEAFEGCELVKKRVDVPAKMVETWELKCQP